MNEDDVNEVLGELPLAPQHSVSSGIDEGFPRESISKSRNEKSKPMSRTLRKSPSYQSWLQKRELEAQKLKDEIKDIREKSKVEREEREKERAKWRETLYHGGNKRKTRKNKKKRSVKRKIKNKRKSNKRKKTKKYKK